MQCDFSNANQFLGTATSFLLKSSPHLSRTVEDVGQSGSYIAAVDYPVLQSLGKLTCGTDFSIYGNIQELVIPTEIDACLLGLLLVFLPGATIFNEEFRGRVDVFLQKTGLDKIQEGGGFFERLQEGFNRLQSGQVSESLVASPDTGYGFQNEVINSNPAYPVISSNLAPVGNFYQPSGTKYQAGPQPQSGPGATYQGLDLGLQDYGNYQGQGTSYSPQNNQVFPNQQGSNEKQDDQLRFRKPEPNLK